MNCIHTAEAELTMANVSGHRWKNVAYVKPTCNKLSTDIQPLEGWHTGRIQHVHCS